MRNPGGAGGCPARPGRLPVTPGSTTAPHSRHADAGSGGGTGRPSRRARDHRGRPVPARRLVLPRRARRASWCSNLAIGLGFALCGALIAWHRPRTRSAGSTRSAESASSSPRPPSRSRRRCTTPAPRAPRYRPRCTAFAWAWPLHIGVALPLSLLLLPDGGCRRPRWRPVFVAIAVDRAVVRPRGRHRARTRRVPACRLRCGPCRRPGGWGVPVGDQRAALGARRC